MGYDAEKFIFDSIGALELNGLIAGLLIELRVLNRDRGLPRHGREKLDLFLTKVVFFSRVEAEHTKQFLLDDERNP